MEISYYEDNKEHIKELMRNRYANNKDKINKKMVCEFCGRTVIARMYKKHCETNIHKKGRIKQTVPLLPRLQSTPSKATTSPRNHGWITFK
jgi:ABC-type ATPase with predicted acetyltransferase domain